MLDKKLLWKLLLYSAILSYPILLEWKLLPLVVWLLFMRHEYWDFIFLFADNFMTKFSTNTRLSSLNVNSLILCWALFLKYKIFCIFSFVRYSCISFIWLIYFTSTQILNLISFFYKMILLGYVTSQVISIIY